MRPPRPGIVFVCTPLLAAIAVGQSQSSKPEEEKDEASQAKTRVTKVVQEKGGFTGALPVRKGDAPTMARQAPTANVVQVQLKAVEQTVGDLGPLEHPLRDVEQGIELPMGFYKVYKVPGYDEQSNAPELQPERRFMRASGGLAALYDRSNYIPTEHGLLPDVPESTIWVIGGVPLSQLPGHGMLLPVDPLNPDQLPQRHSVPPPPQSMVDGEQVGFGNAPESMWIAQSKHKLQRSDVRDDAGVEGESLRMPFLKDQAYRRERLQILIDKVLR